MTNPSYPAPPVNTYGGDATVPAPPSPIRNAFFIYLFVALLSLVGVVLGLTSNVWNEALAANNTSGVDTQTLINTAKVVTVVVGLIFLALYLLFAFKMRAGRNWARIVLTVLSALSIISTLSASGTATVNGHVYKASGTQVLGWLEALLAIVAIILMFLPLSNAYFASAKGARQRV